jgi:uncharacterized protein YndB with AHSA1/START domain
MGKRVDTGSRRIEADPGRVYAAFVDPEAVIRWLPPADMTGRMLAFDPRPDGPFRMELTFRSVDHATPGKTSAHSDLVEGRFVRLEPDREIAQAFTFRSDDPAFAGVMTMVWTFAPEGAGTRVTVRAEDVPPGIDPGDHETGIRSSLDNLARYVE